MSRTAWRVVSRRVRVVHLAHSEGMPQWRSMFQKSFASLSPGPSYAPNPWARKASGRAATCRGSSCLRVPAVALRGLANAGSPSASRSSFSLAKASLGMKTSPRTSSTGGSAGGEGEGDAADGADVGRYVVPHVSVSARGRISQLPIAVHDGKGHAVNLGLHGDGHVLRLQRPGQLMVNSASSSSGTGASRCSKMSSIDNMGTACLIWLKPWRGAPPTRRVGESGSDSSGWAFSNFSSSRNRASYSASEISGSACS